MPEHQLIERCTVLPNDSNRCGWVAASILLRYWQARLPRLGLIGAAHLAGDDIVAPENGPDLADVLRGPGHNASWGASVARRLNHYLRARGLAASAAWRPLALGARHEIEQGRPVILFGDFPGAGYHAVLAYGLTSNRRRFVVHYGWHDLTMLPVGGMIGSVTTLTWPTFVGVRP